MASQRKERLPHAVTAPERWQLIKEALIGLETLAGPAPRWLGRAHHRRPSGTAAERQIEKAPKKEKKALI
jgi:hypothetical protein